MTVTEQPGSDGQEYQVSSEGDPVTYTVLVDGDMVRCTAHGPGCEHVRAVRAELAG